MTGRGARDSEGEGESRVPPGGTASTHERGQQKPTWHVGQGTHTGSTRAREGTVDTRAHVGQGAHTCREGTASTHKRVAHMHV